MRTSPILGAAFFVTLVVAPLAAQRGEAPASSKAFRAQWSVSGTIQELEMGPDRSAGTIRLQGDVHLVRTDGRVRDFWATCVGLRDTRTGTVARCVWYDKANADRIYSELSGDVAGRSGTGQGTFVGGSGRYSGIRGGWDVKWVSMVSRGDGSLQVRSVDMTGHWSLP